MEEDQVEDVMEEEETELGPHFGENQRGQADVIVDVGRGGQVEHVPSGSPFVETMEQIADRYNYGGYFRIYLNGDEIVNPEDAPSTIEPGMRLAISAYDKVG